MRRHRTARAKYKDARTLSGIGIGVPGFIDMATGRVMRSPNLADWTNFPVREEIEKRLGTHVILENDANVAAMGEKWLGAGRQVEHMAMYTLGTGVGGGIVLNGRLWHGMTGMAGELGHFNIDSRRPSLRLRQPRLPGAVRLGDRCSAHGARGHRARKAPKSSKASATTRVQFTSRCIYNLAMQGDASAKRIYEAVGRALGIGIGGMVNALNLPMYVIGGGVASAWDAFAPAMFKEMKFRSSIYSLTSPEQKDFAQSTIITRALLGSDAGLYGAARLPMLEGFTQMEKTRTRA